MDTDNIHKPQSEDKQNKNTAKKTKMSTTDRNKNRGWTQLLATGKQFLFLIVHTIYITMTSHGGLQSYWHKVYPISNIT